MNYEEFNRGCFEEAKRLYETANADQKYVLESLFPELKESEDERIRKAILDYLTKMWGNSQDDVCGVHVEDAIAWLEKQGEVESDNDDIEVEEKGIREAFNKIEDEKQCKQKPQRMISAEAKEAMYNKPADTVEPKFKIGDSIKTANEEPLTITEITDNGYWSEDLFICNFDDAAKWELVEQKPAWSIKEKLMLNDIIETTERSNIFKENYQRELIDWLKSLKTRYTWKPSDEQLEALKNAIHIKPFENPSDSILWGLYEQLKKLREE